MNRIDDIYYISGTTTVQAMRSAVQWFQSSFTDDDGTGNYDGCRTTKNECVAGTGRPGDVTVTTPVTEDLYCAQSVIVLLTDGAPYSDKPSSNQDYDDPHPYKAAGYKYDPSDVTVPSPSGTDCTNPDPSSFSMSRAGCTGDIAAWANTHDLHPSITGNQNVITHAIGFHTRPNEEAYLRDIATRGGGNYYESGDTASLVDAINDIIIDAQASIDYTFNAPAIPFDPSNAAASSNDLYLPLLAPDVTKFWKGNLKKYRIAFNTNTEQLDITAQGGAAVVDDNLAFQDVRDFWNAGSSQVCLRPRDRFWDIPVPKIDSAFDNLLVPQPSWSPSTTQQLRKLVAAPYLSPNDWTPRLDAYFASPLALCARRVSSAASRLLGSTSLRFAL
ncbi:hypothetical protein, partial [Thiolapillus sp.]